jgi:hypothetical protein
LEKDHIEFNLFLLSLPEENILFSSQVERITVYPQWSMPRLARKLKSPFPGSSKLILSESVQNKHNYSH